MRAGQNQPAAAREEQQKSEIPFNFTSQIVHLHKDHSLFEVSKNIHLLYYSTAFNYIFKDEHFRMSMFY